MKQQVLVAKMDPVFRDTAECIRSQHKLKLTDVGRLL